jgi:hypothetical protein
MVISSKQGKLSTSLAQECNPAVHLCDSAECLSSGARFTVKAMPPRGMSGKPSRKCETVSLRLAQKYYVELTLALKTGPIDAVTFFIRQKLTFVVK